MTDVFSKTRGLYKYLDERGLIPLAAISPFMVGSIICFCYFAVNPYNIQSLPFLWASNILLLLTGLILTVIKG